MRAILLGPRRVVNKKLSLKFRAPNIAEDSALGIAPSLRHVEKLDHPERPDFCVGRTGSCLVDQCFRAIGDALRFVKKVQTAHLLTHKKPWNFTEIRTGRGPS